MSLNKILSFRRARKGFTMTEALIAVAVLGLVAAASLKLTAIAERGLRSVREYEELLDAASAKKIELMIDPLDDLGVSGDMSWAVTDHEQQMTLDDRIAMVALNFDDDERDAQLEKYKDIPLRWRELEVTYKGKKLSFFLPYDERYIRAKSEDDRRQNL